MYNTEDTKWTLTDTESLYLIKKENIGYKDKYFNYDYDEDIKNIKADDRGQKVVWDTFHTEDEGTAIDKAILLLNEFYDEHFDVEEDIEEEAEEVKKVIKHLCRLSVRVLNDTGRKVGKLNEEVDVTSIKPVTFLNAKSK